MGARYVKGLRQEEWERVDRARAERPFHDQRDLARRSGVGEPTLLRLAEAGAFEGLGQERREALWEGRRLARAPEAPLPITLSEPEARFAALDWTEVIGWDYRTTEHSTRGHPMETIREELRARGLPDAAEVSRMSHGRRVSYAGAVICRQRPGTAKGVTFLTMEDETGFVNVVIWPRVYERHAAVVKTSALLGVTGKLESQQGVLHLIADQVWTPRVRRPPSRRRSRDFH
jgi:error-prone DNA polymerase